MSAYSSRSLSAMLAAGLSASLTLTSCAQVTRLYEASRSQLIEKYQDGTSALGFQAKRSGNICTSFTHPLREAQDEFSTSALGSVLIGARVGAAVDVLEDETGPDKMAFDADIDALASVADSYLNAKRRAFTSSRERQAAINADIQGDIQLVSKIKPAINHLNLCRQRQIAQLRQQVLAGIISNDGARARLATIGTRAKTDQEMIISLLRDADFRGRAYVGAISKSRGVEQALLLGESERYAPKIIAPTSRIIAVFGDGIVTRTASRVRSGPGTQFQHIETLAPGSEVEVVRTENGWSEVKRGGGTAFISADLLVTADAFIDLAGSTLPTVARRGEPDAAEPVNDLLIKVKAATAEAKAQFDEIDTGLDAVHVRLGSSMPDPPPNIG